LQWTKLLVDAICAPNANGIVTGCSTLVTNQPLGPLGVPGPTSYLPPVQVRMPDPNIKTAQTQFWSMDVQRQVARNTQ